MPKSVSFVWIDVLLISFYSKYGSLLVCCFIRTVAHRRVAVPWAAAAGRSPAVARSPGSRSAACAARGSSATGNPTWPGWPGRRCAAPAPGRRPAGAR